MRIALLQLLACLLVGCATKYAAPDSTKMDQATVVVRSDIKRLHENNKATRVQIERAQISADRVVVLTGDIFKQLDEIIVLAPESLRPPLEQVKDNVRTSQAEQGILVTALSEAWNKQTEQDKDLTDTKAHISELEQHQEQYKLDSQSIADEASKLSQKVANYQRQRAFTWITLGAGGILCIVAIVLKFVIK